MSGRHEGSVVQSLFVCLAKLAGVGAVIRLLLWRQKQREEPRCHDQQHGDGELAASVCLTAAVGL